MAFTPITLTGSYQTAVGDTAKGTVVFQLTAELTQPGLPIVSPFPIIVPLVDGQLSAGGLPDGVVLYANDDGATEPQLTSYQVTEQIGEAPYNSYFIIIPSGAPGGTIDLTELDHATTTPQFYNGGFGQDFETNVRSATSPDQLEEMGNDLTFGGFRGIDLANGIDPTDAATVGQLSGGGGPLASTYYEPGTASVHNTTSTAMAAIDTTNLTLSFTATTTETLITLEAFAATVDSATATSGYYWGLFTHGTTTPPTGSYIDLILSHSPAGVAGLWRIGTGIPSNGLGAPGDFYENGSTGIVYFKSSGGTYSAVGTLSSPSTATAVTVGSSSGGSQSGRCRATIRMTTVVGTAYSVDWTHGCLASTNTGTLIASNGTSTGIFIYGGARMSAAPA